MLEGPVCDSDPYPRYPPGEYEVRCLQVSVYRDPRFHRIICRLKCVLMTEPWGEIYGFLNLGTGAKPAAGRGSNYRRAWVIANGEAPRKRQVLRTKVFEGKVFQVLIGDVSKGSDGSEHPEPEKYSTIERIISRRWP